MTDINEAAIRESRLKRLDRFDVAMGMAVLVLLAAIGLIIARGDQIGVVVEDFGPVQIASSKPLIQVDFDAPIDVASVESHVSLNPAVDTFITVADNKVFVSPKEPLQPNQSYEVTLDAGIASTAGRYLKQAVSWQFRVRTPRITYIDPNN